MKLIESSRVFLAETLQDVRFSARVLRRSPGFTVAAVLTLALGIGANALVFGVFNALVLRPLNVPRAESLYGLEQGNEFGWQSYPNYRDLHERNRSFDGLAAFNISQAGIDTGSEASQIWCYQTSANYFDVLGLTPHLGRFYHAADEQGSNSAPYLVLTHAYWQSRFQGDRDIVGRVVRLNKRPFTVLGVAPPGFRGTLLFFAPDGFLPMVNAQMLEGVDYVNARSRRWIMQVIGHLKPGVSRAEAIADLNSIGQYIEKNYPEEAGRQGFSLARPSLYGDAMGGPVQGFVAVLMLLVGLILLAACANVGALFSARASDRAAELALRLALGSSRLRVLRQLVTESLVIAVIGGVLGLSGSIVLLRLLSTWQPFPRFPMNIPMEPGAMVYLAALLLALASGLVSGLAPLREVLRTDPFQVVNSVGRNTSARGTTVRDVLLGLQIATCVVLVTCALVAVRGQTRSLQGNFGFDPQNAMLVDTDLTMAGYIGDAVAPMQRRMIDALAAVPGVEAVGSVNFPPLGMGGDRKLVFKDDATEFKAANSAGYSMVYHVSPDYLRAARTALLAGRSFSWHDDAQAPRVAVVNRTFAEKVLGSMNAAVGAYYRMADGARIQVVGVVEDGKYLLLTEEAQPAAFLPVLQSPLSQTYLVVRSERDVQQLAEAVRGTLRGVDSGLPFTIQTWHQAIGGALFPSRVAAVSLSALGLMCAVLSFTGIFGMAAYSVSKRRRELGVRIAVGARREEVLWAALGRPFRWLAAGSAAGLGLGLLATPVMALLVYQANPRDPLVLTGVALIMLLLSLLATWIPAQRALAVNPANLLRDE